MIANMLTMFYMFAGPPRGCTHSFLGLKAWFAYFPSDWFGGNGIGRCDINNKFAALPKDGQSGLLLIALAIVDDLLRIAALVAVGYVIYGGIQFVTSQGSPDATSKARQTIINALIGLVLAIIATSIVAFVGSRIT